MEKIIRHSVADLVTRVFQKNEKFEQQQVGYTIFEHEEELYFRAHDTIPGEPRGVSIMDCYNNFAAQVKSPLIADGGKIALFRRPSETHGESEYWVDATFIGADLLFGASDPEAVRRTLVDNANVQLGLRGYELTIQDPQDERYQFSENLEDPKVIIVNFHFDKKFSKDFRKDKKYR